jgi:hypothetical protein
MYTIKLPAKDGDLFYTGRAGQYYLSAEQSDAFTYRSESEARIKARRMNVARPGIRFEVSKVEKTHEQN